MRRRIDFIDEDLGVDERRDVEGADVARRSAVCLDHNDLSLRGDHRAVCLISSRRGGRDFVESARDFLLRPLGYAGGVPVSANSV